MKARFLPLNRLRWPVRLPLKTGLFALAVLIVSFPRPDRLWVHLSRWQDPQRLVEPDHPEIQAMAAEIAPRLAGLEDRPRAALFVVQEFVLARVPYDWDWNTWGIADYLPTVSEVFAKGREDCDGRAVVAASLLARLGYQPQLVTDFAHVWVYTEQGELMGPGQAKAAVATEQGVEMRPGALAQLPAAFTLGVRVFPLVRELILVLVLWYLLLSASVPAGRQAVVLLALTGGLIMMRSGPITYPPSPDLPLITGAGVFVAGGLLQLTRPARRQPADPI